ncbi:hypothetical protein VRU48_14535 [Pedobacter sp. KR3-3]|uniref:DUF2975 domain-containing protein n=1 Tax=Pedobacter albus TaxID=3113905 RepID=A0ABU7IAF6_9SPHI|nr:hypothetical protein [Pedobacter sp. KR3-3]MEE1946339.1 hypothetical protein [Pedobacter sp. KR3-3]
MLQVLYVLSWIIFIGVCIEAGAFIWNAVYALAINPAGAKFAVPAIDLSPLYAYDKGYFGVLNFVMCLVAVMRALLFWLIVKILHDKQLDLSEPFNDVVRRFIANMAYLSLFIGAFSYGGVQYVERFAKEGVKMPDVEYLRLGGADVWLFMGVILLVIAYMFKRGIEIQSEHELTV